MKIHIRKDMIAPIVVLYKSLPFQVSFTYYPNRSIDLNCSFTCLLQEFLAASLSFMIWESFLERLAFLVAWAWTGLFPEFDYLFYCNCWFFIKQAGRKLL